jgi:hypothetical protein
MTNKEFEKEIVVARELDFGGNGYSYTSGVYFKRDIEKYCQLITPKHYPFSNPILVFDLEKIRKDKVHYIPESIMNIEYNCGPEGRWLLNILESTRLSGCDGFRIFLQDLIEKV